MPMVIVDVSTQDSCHFIVSQEFFDLAVISFRSTPTARECEMCMCVCVYVLFSMPDFACVLSDLIKKLEKKKKKKALFTHLSEVFLF